MNRTGFEKIDIFTGGEENWYITSGTIMVEKKEKQKKKRLLRLSSEGVLGGARVVEGEEGGKPPMVNTLCSGGPPYVRGVLLTFKDVSGRSFP